MSNSALASLTATYTDSEGEEDANDDDDQQQGSVSTPNSNENMGINSRTSSPISSSVNLVAGGVGKLVSYHDDTIISDDDGVVVERMETNEAENLGPPEPEPISDDGIQLPPEPVGKCPAELQEKIQRLYEKMNNNGLDMNYVIQQRKDFRNPSIYEKLIQFCGINELGTNYPPHMYDPLRWGKESFYEDLAKVQKQEMDKREKERKAKVEVVSGTRRPGSAADDDAKRRKSKWDQPGGNNAPSQKLQPAGLIQPTLTSSATGTKGTVISAFGSLPRKPKI